jgi:hypothetical protein
MFDPTSRYYPLETASLPLADGSLVAYVRRRTLPQVNSLPILAEVSLLPGERLDLLAARTLGDPTQYWRICDANDALDPLDLLETGGLLRIPLPQPV